MGANGNSAKLRARMVESLRACGALHSEEVGRAFLNTPREHFVAEVADRDGLEAIYKPGAALPIATDRSGHPISSSSAPEIMAPMLEALDLRPGLSVLEIGAGTGYNAAILSALVGDRGRVVSVEVDAPIARRARRSLADLGRPVEVVEGDGRLGWPTAAPFDRIIATASSDTVPLPWRDQLVEGGLVILPLRVSEASQGQLVVAFRREGSRLTSTRVIAGGFMGLRSPGQEAATAFWGATSLQATVSLGPGRGETLVRLCGPAVASLPASRRRQLLGVLLQPPRSVRQLPPSTAAGLAMFIRLRTTSRTVECQIGERFGFGYVGKAADGAVLFTRAGLRSGPGRIEAWGDLGAEKELNATLEEWETLGRPRLADLHLAVSYDQSTRTHDRSWWWIRRDRAVIEFHWRT